MTREENEIMRDAYYYLRDHDDPPAEGTAECAAFWEKAAKDVSALVGGKWKNHPLATDVMIGIYSYLEKKCKAKAGDSK